MRKLLKRAACCQNDPGFHCSTFIVPSQTLREFIPTAKLLCCAASQAAACLERYTWPAKIPQVCTQHPSESNLFFYVRGLSWVNLHPNPPKLPYPSMCEPCHLHAPSSHVGAVKGPASLSPSSSSSGPGTSASSTMSSGAS